MIEMNPLGLPKLIQLCFSTNKTFNAVLPKINSGVFTPPTNKRFIVELPKINLGFLFPLQINLLLQNLPKLTNFLLSRGIIKPSVSIGCSRGSFPSTAEQL